MTKDELRKQYIEEINHINAVIDSIPDEFLDDVLMTGKSGVYFLECSYNRMIEMLHGQKYKIKSYFISGENLAVVYTLKGNIDWIFYIPPENLDNVSGGKCRIDTVTRTEKSIVCEV